MSRTYENLEFMKSQSNIIIREIAFLWMQIHKVEGEYVAPSFIMNMEGHDFVEVIEALNESEAVPKDTKAQLNGLLEHWYNTDQYEPPINEMLSILSGTKGVLLTYSNLNTLEKALKWAFVKTGM